MNDITYISSIIGSCVTKGSKEKLTTSDKIDRIVTNRWLALPIFAAVMFLVYYVSVTTVGTWATDWANDGVFGDGWSFFGISVPGCSGSCRKCVKCNRLCRLAAGIDSGWNCCRCRSGSWFCSTDACALYFPCVFRSVWIHGESCIYYG